MRERSYKIMRMLVFCIFCGTFRSTDEVMELSLVPKNPSTPRDRANLIKSLFRYNQ